MKGKRCSNRAAALAFLIVAGSYSSVAQSQESASMSGEQVKDLAVRSYTLMKELYPMVYVQHSYIAADNIVYGRTFDNPVSNLMGEWPISGSAESSIWGGYFYCSQALTLFYGAGFAQHSRSEVPSESRKADFDKAFSSCEKYSQLSPEEVAKQWKEK